MKRLQLHRLRQPQTQLALGVMGLVYLVTLALALIDDDIPTPQPTWRAGGQL